MAEDVCAAGFMEDLPHLAGARRLGWRAMVSALEADSEEVWTEVGCRGRGQVCLGPSRDPRAGRVTSTQARK